ncbi:MAG: polysaccharide biosynthesis protein [Ruminococcaceae bacterium]|nr:polysaccharide biosynthesis protein [Oscillospiraceae bacterium]
MGAERQNSVKVFFSGVLLLSLSTVLVKIIGLIYKIPMLSYLGSEGMGYFNSAYEIYALFCVIATAGLPVALSVLISGAVANRNPSRVEQIYSVAFRIFLGIGLVGCGAMWLFARQFCKWIQSENAYGVILAIAPTFFFVCVSSAIRGYFQGFQRMLPTALSQLLESVGKLVFGLLFASLALNSGQPTESVAAAAGWGLSFGTALSTAYLIIAKRRSPITAKIPRGEVCKSREGEKTTRALLSLALPMTLGASLASVIKLIDMAMILRGLQSIGYTEALANEAYGSYTTLAISIFSLLPTLLNSISLPLVPILSAAIAAKDERRQQQMIETSYRLTAFFAIPASLGIACFSRQILSLVFLNQTESIEVASPLLSLLGISVFLSCMITATNSVLHSYKIVKRPILSLVAGAIVKLGVAYYLIGNPSIGLLGAPISSFCCNVTVVLMNFCFASHFSQSISIGKIFMFPLLNGTLSVGFVFLFHQWLSNRYTESNALTLICLGLAVLLYLLLSILSGSVGAEDLRTFLGKDRLSAHKNGLFKENEQKNDE